MKHLKLLRILLLVFIAIITIAMPIFAIGYSATFTIDNTSATAYTMLPVISNVDNTYLASNGYITATALDTRVESGSGSAKPHMVASDKTLAASVIPATSQTNLYYSTGNTALTSMDILTGYNGYIEISDVAALELSNNFSYETEVYIDTAENDFIASKFAAFDILNNYGTIVSSISQATNLGNFRTTFWRAQTFTTTDARTVSEVWIALARQGSHADTLTVSIRATAAGLPTGADLTSGTININSIVANGTWAKVSLTPYALANATTYAIVYRIAAGDGFNQLLAYGVDPGAYAGGQYCTSTDSGATWASTGTADAGFVIGNIYDLCSLNSVSTTTTGEKVVTAYATGGGTNLLGIQIGTGAPVTAALAGASVPDNDSNWMINNGSVSPYLGYLKMTVAGTLIAHYQPVAIISNTRVDGTADAGGDVNTIIDAVLTQADDYWNYALVTITDTTDNLAPIGETAYVLDFASATDEITLASNLTAGVDAGDTYTVEYGTLPDREGAAQDARIGWGVNPTGTSVTLGGMVSDDQPSAITVTETPSTEILPEVTVSDWFVEPAVTGALLTNPMRPFVTILSDTTSLTEMQSWRFLGLVLTLMITMVCIIAVRGHLLIAGIACGASVGAMVALTVFPFWALIFAVGAVGAGLIAERSPSI